MIITRSPLRITLGGGGTDLPSYYREHGGFLIAAAIDKYVYMTVTDRSCRHLPEVLEARARRRADDVHHPIIREAIKLVGFEPQVEISTLADIPAGTGLGSSAASRRRCLKALAYRRGCSIRTSWPSWPATSSWIELERADRQAGPVHRRLRQALPALRFIGRRLEAEPLKLPIDSMFNLEATCCFFSPDFRERLEILADQEKRTERGAQRDVLHNLHFVKDLGHRSRLALEGRYRAVWRADARALGTQEVLRIEGMTNPRD